MHVTFTNVKDEKKFLSLAKSLCENIKVTILIDFYKSILDFYQKSEVCLSTGVYKEASGDSFAIIESWESEELCDKDTSSEHVEKFLAELGDTASVDIKKYLSL